MTEAYIPTLRTGEPLTETQRKCAGIGTSLETVRAALTTAEGTLANAILLRGSRHKLGYDFDPLYTVECPPMLDARIDTESRVLEGKFWVPAGMDYAEAGLSMAASGTSAFDADVELKRGSIYDTWVEFVDTSSHGGALGGSPVREINAGPVTFAFDIICKINASTVSNHQWIVGKRNALGGTGAGWAMRYNSNTGLLYAQSGDGTNQNSATEDISALIGDDEWHRFTYLLSREDDTVYLFIDGVEVGSHSITGWAADWSNSNVFSLGQVGSHHYLNGSICWMCARYGDHLTTTLIEAEGAAPSFDNLDRRTDVWWDFDEGQGADVQAYPFWRRSFFTADGSTGRLTMASSPASMDADDETLDIAFIIDAATGSNQVIYVSTKHTRLKLNGSGLLFIDYYLGGSWRTTALSGSALDLNYLHRLRVTYNSADSTVNAWLNDTKAVTDSTAHGGSGALPAHSGQPELVNFAGASYFGGTVHLMRLWGEVLTSMDGFYDIHANYQDAALTEQRDFENQSAGAVDSSGNSLPDYNITGTVGKKRLTLVLSNSPAWGDTSEVLSAEELVKTAAGAARCSQSTGPFAVSENDRIYVRGRQNSGSIIYDGDRFDPSTFWVKASTPISP